ncbi:MAG: PIN domain-containing protein [Burkholderiaceae bacterium]
MIVVLDTNIWLKELALNTGAGSALRFFLKHRRARLAVPEVIRLEVQRNLQTTVEEAIESVAKGNRQLLALFGSMKEIVLPTQPEIDRFVSNVFDRLGVEILDVPFSLESARSSFLKTVQKVPPSDKTQEFKDGVLWANCLELLDQDDVLLASQDKAFCLNRECGKGLAENLVNEASQKPNKLTLVHSVTDVLSHVEVPINLDERWLTSVIQQRAHTTVGGLISRAGVEISGEGKIQYDLFVTENPDILYMKYAVEFPCTDVSAEDRTNIRLVLTGTGTLQPSVPEIISVHPGEEVLSFTNADGTPSQLGNTFASAHAVLGHRTINYAVRHPLKGTG